jgi:hypothetical protein
MNKPIISSFGIISFIVLNACNQTSIRDVQGEWIRGTKEEKIQKIENQFGGFDKTMMETSYRFAELYFAGQDENWGYADYQLEEMRSAIENGLQRRPARAESADEFLTHNMPEMQRAVDAQDRDNFNESFRALTLGCNNCHIMEDMPFLTVQAPAERRTTIRKL